MLSDLCSRKTVKPSKGRESRELNAMWQLRKGINLVKRLGSERPKNDDYTAAAAVVAFSPPPRAKPRSGGVVDAAAADAPPGADVLAASVEGKGLIVPVRRPGAFANQEQQQGSCAGVAAIVVEEKENDDETI